MISFIESRWTEMVLLRLRRRRESSGWESDVGSDYGHDEGNGGRWDDGTDEDFIDAETVAQQ